MIKDILRRFVLEKTNIRGEWVHLDQSWQQLLSRADYPLPVQKVLGEALSAVVLLSATVKHSGSLILQVRGTGAIPLLVVQATPQGEVRGLAQWNSIPTSDRLSDLFGDGQMVITLQAATDGERYQGIIALEGDNLTQALEQYFARSEQLPTRLWLSADSSQCAGLLLQRLPAASEASSSEREQQAEDWLRTSLLLDTVTSDELLGLPAEDLLYRLFHEETPRLFEPKAIEFQCSCSQAKIETMVQSLGEEEARSILDEQGSISVTCEFCNAHYQLDSVDVARLFSGQPIEPLSTTIH